MYSQSVLPWRNYSKTGLLSYCESDISSPSNDKVVLMRQRMNELECVCKITSLQMIYQTGSKTTDRSIMSNSIGRPEQVTEWQVDMFDKKYMSVKFE